jgi:signal transduction histidine kinase
MKLDQTAPPPVMTTVRVVHDLGNLIQIASSAISIVTRTPDMPEIHSSAMLRRARDCLDHAGTLVRNSLGVLRDSAVTSECGDVGSCLNDVGALLDSMCDPEIGVELDVPRGLPEVRCDPAALHSAVLNLALNARAAVAGSGTIVIRGRAIADGKVTTGVEISIADNGIGMSDETIIRAFDPFFTTKSDGLGGVGLPMVKRFVRNAHGDVSIESEPGLGTIVSLRLPASAPVICGE